jgi:carbon-monoxide dehydrogenase small subunit
MMESMALTIVVNGVEHGFRISETTVLSDLLREHLRLTSVKIGCDQGVCGACTVLLNGRPAIACMTFAFEAEGQVVTTLEGIGRGGPELHPVQQALVDGGAVQCGFCTPGIVLSVIALLEVIPTPDRATIRQWLAGHVCRCTGYEMIIDSVQVASDRLNPPR